MFNKIINNRNYGDEILDYNSSVSLIILKYFSKNIVEQYNDDGTENVVYLFLSSIKIYQEYVDLSGYMECDDNYCSEHEKDEYEDDYYFDNEDKFKKRDPKYDEEYKMTNILLQNLPNLTDLHLYYSYTADFFENLSIYCKQLKKLEINWAKIDLDMKSIGKNTNIESFIFYEANSSVKIINFEYLNNLVNLKDIFLELTQNLTKLPDLYLPELLEIDIDNLNNITKLGNFVFPKLIECTLGNNNKIEDISFLRNSKHLKKIKSYMTNIKDYSFLNVLEELEELNLNGNIKLKKITPHIKDLLEKNKIQYTIIPKSTRSPKSRSSTKSTRSPKSRSSTKTTRSPKSRSSTKSTRSPKSRSSTKTTRSPKSRSSTKTSRTTSTSKSRSSPKTSRTTSTSTSRSSSKTR